MSVKTNILKFSFLVVFGLMPLVSFSKGIIQGTAVGAESNESLGGKGHP